MQIHLIRHGDARKSVNDYSRALSEKGILEVELLSRKIQEEIALKKLFVDKIYHSGLLRAKETAEIIFKSILNIKLKINSNLILNSNQINSNQQELQKGLIDIDIEEDTELSPYNDNHRYLIDKYKNNTQNGNRCSIMLVGHMPSLTKMSHYLLSVSDENNFKKDLTFATANMISFERSEKDESWNYLWKIIP